VSRVRENRTHGSRWRREETGTSRHSRAELGASRRPYRATSVTGAWEAGGSFPFCLAPRIGGHCSAAFASIALGAI